MKEMTVGERIQQLRKAAGLSQEQLATFPASRYQNGS
jgi:transcriptional regulator with XRE-family HTH domain